MDARIKTIADHYGFETQSEKAIEELADVKIMVDQLIYLTEKDAEDYFNVGEAIESKIQRTLKRIRNEEYDVHPDAITARKFMEKNPETLKALGIFD